MKKTPLINGELITDILAGAQIEEYHSQGSDWFILARTGRAFTQYETDDFLEFHITKTWTYSRPTSLKMFRESIKDRVTALQAVDPAALWRKGMTKGEYDAIIKENERLKTLSEND